MPLLQLYGFRGPAEILGAVHEVEYGQPDGESLGALVISGLDLAGAHRILDELATGAVVSIEPRPAGGADVASTKIAPAAKADPIPQAAAQPVAVEVKREVTPEGLKPAAPSVALQGAATAPAEKPKTTRKTKAEPPAEPASPAAAEAPSAAPSNVIPMQPSSAPPPAHPKTNGAVALEDVPELYRTMDKMRDLLTNLQKDGLVLGIEVVERCVAWGPHVPVLARIGGAVEIRERVGRAVNALKLEQGVK